MFRLLLFVFLICAGSHAYAVDLLAPFKGLKNLFSDDEAVVIWKGQGQYIKIVEQDWGKDHKRAEKNDHPASITAPQMAVVLASLQAWRPEDSPGSDRSVQLFTNDAISLFSPMLAEALSKAMPKQDVVFAIAGNHQDFPRDRSRTTAARMFVHQGRLNLIFGDILRPTSGDADDISHFSKPHRAGKRMEPYGRDIVVRDGTAISYYRHFERPRLDWIMVDVPTLVAAYRGPALTAPPAPVVSTVSSIPAGDSLSAENRKLREELARMRKQSTGDQTAGNQAAATAVTQPEFRSMPAPQVMTPVPVPDDMNSIQKRLQLLKELHDQGLITDQEYDAKRKEIVEQI